jgi:hypothetical protein
MLDRYGPWLTCSKAGVPGGMCMNMTGGYPCFIPSMLGPCAMFAVDGRLGKEPIEVDGKGV